MFVSRESEEVLGWVGLDGNGGLICDSWLLYGVWTPVHKLYVASGELL